MIGNAHAAFDAYARALRDDSGNQLTLGHIERLAEITGTWRAARDAVRGREPSKSLDVPRQVDLLSRLARVYEQELDDVAKSIATLRKLLEVEFDNKPAVLALDRLYTQTARVARAHRDPAPRDPARRAATPRSPTLQFRLGQTLENQLGDRKGAVEVYREILTGAPDARARRSRALEKMFHAGHLQLEIAAVLEPLYEAAERVREAARHPRGAARRS